MDSKTLVNTLLAITLASWCQAQNQWTANGFGQSYLAPNALNPAPITNATVGTTPGLLGTLRVRGDQLPINDAFFPTHLCTFRTDVLAGNNQTWSMVRGSLLIGKLYHTNPSNAFNVKAAQGDGNLWLRNSDDDGIRLNANGVGVGAPSLNGYILDRQGFGAIGEDFAMNFLLNPNAPWARWHLVHPNQGATPPHYAFRIWMRNGVMGTGNSDLFYIGHKYAMSGGTGAEVDDRSDFVAAWADDVLPSGPQSSNNFSFRFMGSNGLGGSAGSIEGLEIMRLRPFRNLPADPIQGFVGIGDWVNAGLLPTERLDIMDGRVAIRQLPLDPISSAATQMMVVNPNGVVGWQNIPTGGGGATCDWDVVSGDVLTAYQASGSAGACPEIDNRVGIGDPSPDAKLDVTNDPSETNVGVGISSQQLGTFPMTSMIGIDAESYGNQSTYNYGLFAKARNGASGPGSEHVGVFGWAYCDAGLTPWAYGTLGKATEELGTAQNLFGAYGEVQGVTDNSVLHGVHGYARRLAPGTDAVIGVYGAASDGSGPGWGGAGGEWAGFFDGDINVAHDMYANGNYYPSDSTLKQNIEDLTDPNAVLEQLAPKTYTYDTIEYGYMGVPGGDQAGLLAQEVEQVVPSLVSSFISPARYDSTGVLLHPSMSVKAIDYARIVPYLIAGWQVQHASIGQLQDELAQLQTQLAACCSGQDAGGVLHMMPNTGGNDQGAKEQRLMVHPNPFTNTTNIAVALDHTSKVSMTVMSLSGQMVRSLELGQAEPGIFTYVWDTGDIAPGQYVITILLDGKAETAQVVKLADR